jgi:hypothetical protein
MTEKFDHGDEGWSEGGQDTIFELANDYFDVAEPLPERLLRAASDLYTWHNVDAELLELLMDSASMELTTVRAEPAARMIAFGTAERGLHLECIATGSTYVLEGQLVPAIECSIEVERPGETSTYATNNSGTFRTDPLAPGSVRLIVQAPGGQRIMITPWFVLET